MPSCGTATRTLAALLLAAASAVASSSTGRAALLPHAHRHRSQAPVATDNHPEAPTTTGPAKLPHIVLYLMDDLGWNLVNLGGADPHNPEVDTPAIAALAQAGVVLDRHYTYRYCSPSRASLLSGRLPIHVGEVNPELSQPGFGMDVRMTTLADQLRVAGYRTHQLGKWHCAASAPQYLPRARGFDSSFGYLGGGEAHFTQRADQGPGGIFPPDLPACEVVDLWNTTAPAFGRNGTYSAFLYTDEAVRIIRAHDAAAGPLFLYYAAQETHAPNECPDRFKAPYANCSWCTDLTLAIYGMVGAIDESLANITAALRETGMYDDALILVASDNGGDLSKNNYPLRGSKYADFEGGVRTVAFLSGGFLPAAVRGTVNSKYIHIADWYRTFAQLAGLTGDDENATGVPPVDSLNMWPMLTTAVPSPRTEIPLSSSHGPAHWGWGMNATGPCIVPGRTFDRCSQGALIVGDWKLYYGPGGTAATEGCQFCWWDGRRYPNASQPYANLTFDPFQCPPQGCLFNIIEDPTEHSEVSAQHPDIVQALRKRFEELQETVWWSGGNATFSGADLCADVAAHGGFFAPYRTAPEWPPE